MSLEDHFAGDSAFTALSEAAETTWVDFKSKDDLLALVNGDLEVSRVITFHIGENYKQWLNSRVPALNNETPINCLKSITGTKRVKECLLRIPC